MMKKSDKWGTVMNDNCVENKTLKQWKSENNITFPLLEAWLVCVEHEMYKGVSLMVLGGGGRFIVCDLKKNKSVRVRELY